MSDNYTYLTAVALNITHSRDKASDLLSEVYITICERGYAVPDEASRFIKYFTKCMKNASMNQRSSFNKLKFKEVLSDCEKYIQERSETDSNAFDNIIKFKEQLPPHENILFELHYEKNLSYKEISALLTKIGNYPVNLKTVERLIKPIKEKLKQQRWKLLYS